MNANLLFLFPFPLFPVGSIIQKAMPFCSSPSHSHLRLTFFFNLFIFFFTEVELIYHVVLISTRQHSDSVVHIHTFFFTLFSIMAYHRVLNTVLCAAQ